MKIKFITSKRHPIAYSMYYEYDYFCVKDQKEIDELNKNDIVSNLDELDIKLKSFF